MAMLTGLELLNLLDVDPVVKEGEAKSYAVVWRRLSGKVERLTRLPDGSLAMLTAGVGSTWPTEEEAMEAARRYCAEVVQ